MLILTYCLPNIPPIVRVSMIIDLLFAILTICQITFKTHLSFFCVLLKHFLLLIHKFCNLISINTHKQLLLCMRCASFSRYTQVLMIIVYISRFHGLQYTDSSLQGTQLAITGDICVYHLLFFGIIHSVLGTDWAWREKVQFWLEIVLRLLE